ncbi:NFX1-type zinc finger-containing protein 1-like [Gigantopelta aegis]|uniref:NFX1-type zinc finger-containing protein 1-like n=1 Tax=Gigantopelta aegis TaxID=1735272 RepID=UPI001B888A85|nr:NFX1-type zinc finger-containing protein 1-like [Gigantopelta aegis]
MNNHNESYEFNNRMIKQYQNGLVHEDTLSTVMSYRHYELLTNGWIPKDRCPDNGTRLLIWLDVKVSQPTGNIAKGMTDDIFWTEEDLFEEDKERLLDISDDMENDEDQNNIPKMALNEMTLVSEKYWQNVPSNERLKLFISVVNTVNTNDKMSSVEEYSVINIWQLDVPQRWRLYRHWIWNATSKYRTAVSEAEFELEESCQLDKEVRAALDVQIMREARVVAMTTTGAAQYSSALQIVAPAVVIVEEAAQVAEPHVIGALSQSCQHLIMIGDHQQLQPSYNDFQLCKKYKTDVSLFERWIRSGMEYKQLQLQHRMRPEISSLLKPHIYKTLDDHDSVFEYKNIRGMATNLFFLDHDHLEDHSEGSLSHRNQHEAKMITKLYRHLILQCYSPDDITILTPYKDQVYLLKGIIQEMEQNDPVLQRTFPSEERKKVRITAVDNYQGEENKIILISLVRSNRNKNIGYLSRANRICVILSRAREGLYIIGNMNMLKEKSTLWGEVLLKAEETQNIGKILKLKCEKHKVEIAVEKPEDFAKIADGGCNQACETRLECGHACSRKCHISDKSHKLPCKKQCSKVCPRGHLCQKECHEKCGDCKEKVMVELESCGHTQEILCYRDPRSEQCKERCTKKLDCGHVCQRKCGERCNTPSNCMELVKIDARCGHNIQIACFTRSNPDCRVPCQGILKCGHQCKGMCGKCFHGNLHQECTENCTHVLICGHACSKKCNIPCGPCTQKCENKCCHSKCKKECGDVCNMCIELCRWRCKSGCPNKFECKHKCGEPCDRSACNHPCKRKLLCKHRCAGFYCEPCFCLECQDDDPREIFFGAEDEPDSIFYQLPDCKHIFESFGLDTYMEQTSADDSIRRKECPKCKSPVLNAQRYNNVIKSAQKDIEEVKKRFLSSKDALREKKKLIRSFKNIPRPCQHIVKTSNTVQAMDRVLMFLQNRDTFVDSIMSIMNEINQEGEKYIDIDQVHHLMNELINLDKWLTHRDTFSAQQVDECQMEITRIKLWWKICRIKGHVSQKHDQASLDDKDKIESMALDMGKTKLSQDEADKVSKFIAEAEQKFQMCGLSKDEKIMIVKAMDYSKQGHWYKCKNGHIYTIGNCGGAMVTSSCPECGEVIGGQNHRLADGNDVAGEMDGATYGAWSEHANMENYNFDAII